MRIRVSVFGALTCAFGVACGDGAELEGEQPREAEEIINGAPASDTQVSKHGALFLGNGLFRRYRCGATYLGENGAGEHWVLTAAHCVDDGAGPFFVGFGTDNRNAFRRRDLARVDRILLHGRYDRETIQNDVAVLRVAERPSRAIQVELVDGNAGSFSGEIAEIVGFGRGSSGPLLQAYTRVISTGRCDDWYSIITDKNICVQDNVGAAQSACQGDSGGPLYIASTGEQAGIASFAAEGCPLEAPQGYSRISAFRSWIRYATDGL